MICSKGASRAAPWSHPKPPSYHLSFQLKHNGTIISSASAVSIVTVWPDMIRINTSCMNQAAMSKPARTMIQKVSYIKLDTSCCIVWSGLYNKMQDPFSDPIQWSVGEFL